MTNTTSDCLIGEASRRSGVHIETIRYYERAGVMPEPHRSAGGQRVYDREQLQRLSFIKRCRELGFSLNEVRGLFALVDGGNQTCNEVHALTVSHLKDLRKKIADMRKIERVLKDMSDQCSQGNVPECPVIDVLFGQS
ncbi:MAG: helix-turn-helix domain-containing protein [Gammaproteobacteria bacterium]|nr:helix-turn-helix domain-containing protein [Gammaproteobacteria bacterium]